MYVHVCLRRSDSAIVICCDLCVPPDLLFSWLPKQVDPPFDLHWFCWFATQTCRSPDPNYIGRRSNMHHQPALGACTKRKQQMQCGTGFSHCVTFCWLCLVLYRLSGLVRIHSTTHIFNKPSSPLLFCVWIFEFVFPCDAQTEWASSLSGTLHHKKVVCHAQTYSSWLWPAVLNVCHEYLRRSQLKTHPPTHRFLGTRGPAIDLCIDWEKNSNAPMIHHSRRKNTWHAWACFARKEHRAGHSFVVSLLMHNFGTSKGLFSHQCSRSPNPNEPKKILMVSYFTYFAPSLFLCLRNSHFLFCSALCSLPSQAAWPGLDPGGSCVPCSPPHHGCAHLCGNLAMQGAKNILLVEALTQFTMTAPTYTHVTK